MEGLRLSRLGGFQPAQRPLAVVDRHADQHRAGLQKVAARQAMPPPCAASAPEDAINAIGAAENEMPVVTPQLEEIFQEKEAAGLATRRHHGGADYLFADGHARWMRLDRAWGNGTSTNLEPTVQTKE